MVYVLLVSNIDTLKCIQELNENIGAIKQIVDVSNSTIANEISAVNTMLVAFTIGLTVVGVLLGIYITWLQRKVSEMSENIKEKEQKIIALAKTVEETDKEIHSDIEGLYARLRNEETMIMLKRLEEVPMDISNLLNLLLARPLNENGYPILKRAFMKLLLSREKIDANDSFNSYRRQYVLLFFQHYLYESLLDNELRPEVEKEFVLCVKCAFRRDIVKSTKDFCRAISCNSASFDKTALLVAYLRAIDDSKFRELLELKEIFQNSVDDNLLVEAIERCTSSNVYLKMFGVEPPIDENKEENDNNGKEI